MRSKFMLGRAAFVAVAFSTAFALRASADHVYIAVGDSLTWGVGENQTNPPPSAGDQGWVAGFTNLLTDPQTGIRPTLINLGIPGETSNSFKTGPADNYSSPFAYALNTNYPFVAPPTQHDLLFSKIAEKIAAASTFDKITIQLGANDLFALATSPAFQGGDAATRMGLLNTMFQTYGANLGQLLGEIRGALPTTPIVLVGYYDPFAPFFNSPADPRFPFSQLSHDAIPALNNTMAFLAANTPGTTFISPYAAFVGHELEYTYVGNAEGNVHPTPAGYGAYVSSLSAVPEPSSFVLLGLGALGVLAVARKRKSA